MPRKRNHEPPPETKLIISREEFRQKLKERLKIGEGLLQQSQNINTIQELENKEDEYRKWNSYNSEFLKVSFNNENNDYKRGYEYAGMMDGVGFVMYGGNPNDPKYRVGKLSRSIKTDISSIEDLINKCELLKEEDKNEIGEKTTSNISTRIPNKELQAELENFVIKNKLKEALERIKSELPELRKEVNLHLSNLNDVNEKERLGFLDQRDVDLKKIRLRAAILDLIEKC